MKLEEFINPDARPGAPLTGARKRSSPYSYRNMVKRQFRKNRLAVWSLRFVLFLGVIAILADVLANEKPLACKYKGEVYFPVFREYLVDLGVAHWQKDLLNAEWNTLDYEWSVFPPVPYLPRNLDHENEHGVSPFATQHVKSLRWKHWMGTDELGRDVLSGMLHGTRIALTIGLVSMGIALFIGLLAGALAGYYGDDRLQVSRARLWLNLISGVFAFFYAFGSRSYALKEALSDSFGTFSVQLLLSGLIFTLVTGVFNILVPVFELIPYLKTKVRVPVDLIISRIIEIMVSVPVLFLIISVTAIITKPSIVVVMLIIGLTAWTGIARFMRAELLRIRNLEYIEAARALGLSNRRILWRHAVPNALSPVLIALAFGIASSILTESLLSFLGIGVPAETITWGSMLSMARQTPSAWWIALFPGIAIFITVTTYNLIGEGLTDALDPRKKS